MAKNEETAVVSVGAEYAVMHHSVEALQEVIRSNIGGGAITQGDLDRVKVPAGGATTWEISTIDGDVAVKEFDGVIVAWKEPRAYWSSSYDGGGTPPDCSSEDGVTGVGDPGGLCDRCPFSQFGTARGDDGSDRDGQACRQVRLMAILQQDDLVPLLLAAPPTSLQNMRRYFLRLSSRAVPYYGVVTRFTLKKAVNKKGVEYSQIEASSLGKLDTEELQKMQAYAQVIGTALERRSTNHREDYGD